MNSFERLSNFPEIGETTANNEQVTANLKLSKDERLTDFSMSEIKKVVKKAIKMERKKRKRKETKKKARKGSNVLNVLKGIGNALLKAIPAAITAGIVKCFNVFFNKPFRGKRCCAT